MTTTVAIIPEEEDTCECCGRPYDHRNPHRQSEMCDCVQNDDGTLSRPEDIPELPCPDCRRWFDEGKDNCKSCDFDLNSFNKPPSQKEMKLRLIFALFGVKDEKEKKHYIICDECERLCHTGEVQYTGGYCCEKCDIWGIAGRTATRVSEEEEDN